MELNYLLDENDYLNFQLYYASKNPQVNKQRQRARILVVLALILLGTSFLLEGSGFIGYYLLASAVIMVFAYLPFSRWLYKKNYKKHVNTNYKDIVSQPINVQLKHNEIETSRAGALSRFKIEEIKNFIETQEYLYAQINNISYFIIPKNKISNMDSVRNQFIEYSKNYAIPFHIEMDWKWK